MRIERALSSFGVASALCICTGNISFAEEGTLGLYALGTGAVGAGQTAPSGMYFTTALSYAQFAASKSIPFGGTTIAAKAYLPAAVENVLVVLPQDILGGHLSVSATGGGGDIRFNASVVGGISGQKSVEGAGATDTTLRVSLGWDISPTFSHKISVSEFFPTGRYDVGFNPNIGLSRFGTDVSWGATYIEPMSKLEFSGTAGFTYEGYNPQTSYRSGNALHFEEGLSKHFDNGIRLGAIAYQYVQVSDDGGSGAALGAFRTRAVAVGPSAGYTTIINDHLVSFGVQVTTEVAAVHRLKETESTFSTTLKF